MPDGTGHFGRYGGRLAPEALMSALEELTAAYLSAKADPAFQADLAALLRDYAARPTLLTEVPRFAAEAGGCRVFLKREDLAHTGSHKINNVLGQALLTRRMGKTRMIAETGAGQHGVATATAAALLGLDCTVYMGEEDTRRQALNVARMRMLGAEVTAVATGSRTLKDAINEAFRDWVTTVETTHYCIGSVMGPHPFPVMVRDFQRVIGVEAREQVLGLGQTPGAHRHGPQRDPRALDQAGVAQLHRCCRRHQCELVRLALAHLDVGRARRRSIELDRLDQLTGLEHGVTVDAVGRQHVEVGHRDPPGAAGAARHDVRVQRGKRDGGIGRLRGDAVVGPAEECVAIVVAAAGRAA